MDKICPDVPPSSDRKWHGSPGHSAHGTKEKVKPGRAPSLLKAVLSLPSLQPAPNCGSACFLSEKLELSTNHKVEIHIRSWSWDCFLSWIVPPPPPKNWMSFECRQQLMTNIFYAVFISVLCEYLPQNPGRPLLLFPCITQETGNWECSSMVESVWH